MFWVSVRLEIIIYTFFINSGIDDDPLVMATLEGYIKAGYLRVFEDIDSCRNYLGSEPVISRLGCITRQRLGKTKRRVILDSKQSGVSRAAGLAYRSVLPRVLI